MEDPAVGLDSATRAAKGSALSKILHGAVSEILRGNKPVTDWSGVVRNWPGRQRDRLRRDVEHAVRGEARITSCGDDCDQSQVSQIPLAGVNRLHRGHLLIGRSAIAALRARARAAASFGGIIALPPSAGRPAASK